MTWHGTRRWHRSCHGHRPVTGLSRRPFDDLLVEAVRLHGHPCPGQALTGVSLGKRTLTHLDFGKLAATFVNVPRGLAVRVAARDDSRERAARMFPGEADPRRVRMAAYRSLCRACAGEGYDRRYEARHTAPAPGARTIGS